MDLEFPLSHTLSLESFCFLLMPKGKNRNVKQFYSKWLLKCWKAKITTVGTECNSDIVNDRHSGHCRGWAPLLSC